MERKDISKLEIKTFSDNLSLKESAKVALVLSIGPLTLLSTATYIGSNIAAKFLVETAYNLTNLFQGGF